MKITKEMLDAPAFSTQSDVLGPGGEAPSAPESRPNEGTRPAEEEGTPAASGAENPVVDEQKVPYSRFETVLKQSREFEKKAERADELEQRLARLEKARVTPEEDEMPSEWKELLGETDAAKKAYQLQKQLYRNEVERLKESLKEDFVNERRQEEEQIAAVEKSIDESFNTLEEALGKKLSEAEKIEVLNAVEEYSPQDEDGQIVAPISLGHAFEFASAKKQAAGMPSKKFRQEVSAISSARSEGTPDTISASNQTGPQWGKWQDKLKELGY